MHRGYTKRWRKRWDKNYHKDPYLWLLMDYFIDFANYKDSEIYFPNVGLIPLKRGQHLFGTRELSSKLAIGRQMLRSRLQLLTNIGFLTLQPTRNYTIATIINYDTYNSLEESNNPQNNQKPTHSQPALNPHLTTPNKDNKVKKVKKNIYGQFENVSLSEDELTKLKSQFTDYQQRIENLSSYIASKGKKYKSHYATILMWSKKDVSPCEKIDQPKEWKTPDYLKDFTNNIGKEIK